MRGLKFECLFFWKKTTTTQQLITCTVMTILLYYLTLPSSHHLSGNLFSASPSIHFPSRVGDIETFESKPPITGHCKLAWQSSRQAFMLVGDLESPCRRELNYTKLHTEKTRGQNNTSCKATTPRHGSRNLKTLKTQHTCVVLTLKVIPASANISYYSSDNK